MGNVIKNGIPIVIVGEPNTGDNLTFISMAYGVIGQGSPDATGHISCSDFVVCFITYQLDYCWPHEYRYESFIQRNKLGITE